MWQPPMEGDDMDEMVSVAEQPQQLSVEDKIVETSFEVKSADVAAKIPADEVRL